MGAATLVEIPIALVFLSRVLKSRANLLAGSAMSVVQLAMLFVGTPTMY